jgi:hypothetical protein
MKVFYQTELAAFGISLMSFSSSLRRLVVSGRSVNCGWFVAVIDILASVTLFIDIRMVFFSPLVTVTPFETRD